jgi:hypothetical protein
MGVNGEHDQDVEREKFSPEELDALTKLVGFAHDTTTRIAQGAEESGIPLSEEQLQYLGALHATAHYFLDEKIPFMQGAGELDAFLAEFNAPYDR